MGMINIPCSEQDALLALDLDLIFKLVARAVETGQAGDLRPLLANCGLYVSGGLYAFEQALAQHRQARTAKKLETTSRDAHKAAFDLRHAIWSRRDQVEADRKDAEVFFVDDDIWPPVRFSKHLSVRVSYRWRRAGESTWTHGSILFTHDYDPRLDYPLPAPARKPSAAKQAQALQRELFETWEHLKLGALCSVRDYFKAGRDGADIPETFHAPVDAYTRRINNFSTDFWSERSQAINRISAP